MSSASGAGSAPSEVESQLSQLLAAVEAATRGDLRRALEVTQLVPPTGSGAGELAANLHGLLGAWQRSVHEKEALLAELQLSQAEVEEANDRLRAEVEERKRAEAQLASLQAELVRTARAAGMSEVATGVLHNVGNVLNSINIASLTLKERLGESRAKRAEQAAEMLVEHQKDIARFVTEDPRGAQVPGFLLALARHQSELNRGLVREADALCAFVSHVITIIGTYQSYGRSSSVFERLPIMEIIDNACTILRSSFEQHAIGVECIDGEKACISTDRHKVLQIVINLLTNARDAVRAISGDRRIEVRVESTAAGVRVSVRDNGVGIARDDLSRIFAYGYTTKPDGHGFGLHTSANAARELGGQVHADSPGPGLGSTFVLELVDGGR